MRLGNAVPHDLLLCKAETTSVQADKNRMVMVSWHSLVDSTWLSSNKTQYVTTVFVGPMGFFRKNAN